MIKLCVADISTVLEPSTTTSTTAAFAGFFGNTTLDTLAAAGYRGQIRRRGCC